MTMPDDAEAAARQQDSSGTQTPQEDPTVSVDVESTAAVDATIVADAEISAPAEREPEVIVRETPVTLQRTVRYGRVMIGGAILGVAVATLICIFFPISEDAQYTMGQVIGFTAIIGAAIGITLGGVFALILGAVAKRRSGGGIAIQTDVR